MTGVGYEHVHNQGGYLSNNDPESEDYDWIIPHRQLQMNGEFFGFEDSIGPCFSGFSMIFSLMRTWTAMQPRGHKKNFTACRAPDIPRCSAMWPNVFSPSSPEILVTISYYLVGGLESFSFFPYIGNNHPNWRTHIFQRGRYTTNQGILIIQHLDFTIQNGDLTMI